MLVAKMGLPMLPPLISSKCWIGGVRDQHMTTGNQFSR